MGTEIERKFLMKNAEYKNEANGVLIKQGYICHNPESVVRVRTYGKEGYLTIKGKVKGLSRDEYEYPVPLDDAEEMLERLCSNYIIEKYRYEIKYKNNLWIVDEFKAHNEGLTVAEIELVSEKQHFESPLWLGEEITYDFRYAGSNLSLKPYTIW